MSRDGTKLMHAHLRIGDSAVFLNDEFPEMDGRSPEALGGTPTAIHLYLPDADQVFARAVAAGAQVRMPLQDMFWGDRFGSALRVSVAARGPAGAPLRLPRPRPRARP